MFLTGLALTVVTCGVLWATSELTYRSTATLCISEDAPHLLYPATDGGRGTFAETQIALLTGRYIVSRALETHGLLQATEIAANDDIEARGSPIRRVSVSRIGLSDMYDVSFAATDPATAQRVVSAVIEAYMQYYTSTSDSHRQMLVRLLGEERSKTTRQLARLTESLRLQQNRSDAHASADGADAALGQELAGEVTRALKQRLVDSSVELEILRSQIAVLRRELQGGSESPLVQGQGNPENGPPAEVRNEAQAREVRELQEKLRSDEREFAFKTSVVQTLRSEVSERLSAQAAMPAPAAAELEAAQMEIDFCRDALRRITERMMILQSESNAPSRVRIIERAKLPESPEEPTPIQKLAVGGTAAFLAPVAIYLPMALIAASRRRRRLRDRV